jgi:hypothetical protein
MSANRTSPSSIDAPPKDHMTLSHIPSTMTNDECFRLTGALPTDRILQLLDDADRFAAAAVQLQSQLETVGDALPDEGFAEDIMYRLARLRDDDAGDEETELDRLVDSVRKMMADQCERTRAAQSAIEALINTRDGVFSDWLQF